MDSLFDLHFDVPTETKTHGDVCDYHKVSRDYCKKFTHWKYDNHYQQYWGNEGENCGKWYVQYTPSTRKYYTTEELMNLFDESNK